MKYDYKTVFLSAFESMASLSDLFDGFGDNDWEFCGMYGHGVAVFRRASA